METILVVMRPRTALLTSWVRVALCLGLLQYGWKAKAQIVNILGFTGQEAEIKDTLGRITLGIYRTRGKTNSHRLFIDEIQNVINKI